MMNTETIADVVASMRGRAEDSRVDRDLWGLYAHRVEAAAEYELGALRDRVKDALAVADQFKGALDHVLNGLLFAKQKTRGDLCHEC